MIMHTRTAVSILGLSVSSHPLVGLTAIILNRVKGQACRLQCGVKREFHDSLVREDDQ